MFWEELKWSIKDVDIWANSTYKSYTQAFLSGVNFRNQSTTISWLRTKINFECFKYPLNYSVATTRTSMFFIVAEYFKNTIRTIQFVTDKSFEFYL